MDQVAIKRLAYSPNTTYQEHAHTETQITLFMSGGVEEQVGDQWRTIGALDFVIKPAGLPHKDQFLERGAQTIQVSVDPEKANEWGITRRLSTYQAKFCPLLARHFLSLFWGIRNSSQHHASESPLAGLMRNIAAMSSAGPKSTSVQPKWLSPIIRRINRDFQQNISVQELARQHEKHPVSLARTFRAHFGQSIKQRVCQLRVQLAANQLCESDRSAAAIAHNCGFSDQSHMNRVFKSVTGIPPVQYRRFVREK
ncbi:AraC family transcriptional regulator [bacterium]|nr:AraC family transcriptional regulator [bacterium]